MKRNVLHFVGSFHQGGSESQAIQLAELLRKDETCNVFLATLNQEGILRDRAEKIGFPIIPEFRLTTFYDLNFLKQLRECAAFIRANKIDIVHTHDFYTNVFGMAAARMARVNLKIASKRETTQMRSFIQNRVEKRLFNIADAIVANSEAVKQHLIMQNISPGKITVISNGLDIERFSCGNANRSKICQSLGLPTDENVKFITLAANLRHPVKNHPMFLRAARSVLQKFPKTHFVIAGEGELKSRLEDLAKQDQIEANVHFIGRCTAIPELLSISSIGVLTSFAEGFSNSILEYMAAGLPVVATRVGGAGEAIIEGDCGFLVESNDDQEMASRLAELLADETKAERLGSNGRDIVEQKFSLDNQLRKTLELYDY